jgi:hypothetical protein
MFSWWPKWLSEEFIVPLRTFGRRHIRWGAYYFQNRGVICGGTVEQRKFIEDLGSRPLLWDTPLSLAEKMLDAIAIAHRCALAKVLADGPKLFRLPAGIEAPLNEVAIPLRVQDYYQPFPAVIVERDNGDHHIVWQQDGCLSVFDLPQDGHPCDFVLMLKSDRTVESYLNEHRFVQDLEIPDVHRRVSALRDDADFRQHRFRASLNFLLLCTIEGIVSDGRVAKPRQVRHSAAHKLANPEVFRPQNIHLFRQRSFSATTPETPGSAKRPHFRRAHWARLRAGVGRTEIKLVLRRAAFINKHRLAANTDESDMTYTADYRSRKPR